MLNFGNVKNLGHKSLQGGMNKHVAAVHEGKKPFKCESCDYCPRFLTFPKLSMISHAQLWLLLFLQISLFIYFNLGHGPIRAKNNVNKQTNLKNNNNQS